jgi:hypothetical protein
MDMEMTKTSVMEPTHAQISCRSDIFDTRSVSAIFVTFSRGYYLVRADFFEREAWLSQIGVRAARFAPGLPPHPDRHLGSLGAEHIAAMPFAPDHS